MSKKVERTYVEEHGDHQHTQRSVIDESSQARVAAQKVVAVLRVLFGLLIGVIGLRFFFKLIGANPGNIFTDSLYALTDLFIWPFIGIKSSPSVNGFAFDVPALIAMIVYALVAWAVIRLVWVLLYRP